MLTGVPTCMTKVMVPTFMTWDNINIRINKDATTIGMKNAFRILVHSKEYTFLILLLTVAFECSVLQLLFWTFRDRISSL